MLFEENISYMGWEGCLRIANEEIELILASVIGPRILRIGFIGQQNFFHLSPADMGRTGGDKWRIYGGHRLWVAPERIPESYAPDNEPVSYHFHQGVLTLTGRREWSTGLVKEMEITLCPDSNRVTVLHRLLNENTESVELAPWAISAFAEGGRAIVPQEPFGEGDDFLLPARSLALWQYTRMQDPRWIWGDKYIQARQDPSARSEQKIGVMNKQGWAAYCLRDEWLIKRFEFDAGARYPDFGSNNEVYMNGDLLEVETLGPLVNLPSGGMTEHTEHWWLGKNPPTAQELSIDQSLLPTVLGAGAIR